MSDTNNSPVGLPAGSFDYDELKKALGAASRVSDDKRDEAIAKAIDDTNQSKFDATGEPGYKVVEQHNEVLGTTENIQVFVGEDAEKPAGKATTGATNKSSGDAGGTKE